MQDTNGTSVQEYTSVPITSPNDGTLVNIFPLYTDQVRLFDQESYRILVQAVDYSGEVFILRSDGLTVTTDELLPNVVQDGPIVGQDLNYQEPTTYLSAHWDEFGDGTHQQEIAYYEAAAGSDRMYPNTRSDIAPFTNVALRRTHTFTNLSLAPETVVYYTTVRAHAVSGATVESTSNGIRVGLSHLVIPGKITVPSFQSNSTTVSVYWDEFSSEVPIRTYEWAIGRHRPSAEQLLQACGDERSALETIFNVMPFADVELSTAAAQVRLNLTHNTNYYVTVRATDEANRCVAVSSSPILVDLTGPYANAQSIRVGPSESLIGRDIGVDQADPTYIVYVRPDTDLNISWGEFSDPESGIDTYEVSLLKQSVCGTNDNLIASSFIAASVSTKLATSFSFEQPRLEEGVAYVVEVRGINQAGLITGVYSQPILLDSSSVVAGTVKDGLDWQNDVVYQSNLSMLSVTFSHTKLPPDHPGVVYKNDPCPTTAFHSLTTVDAAWSKLVPTMAVGIDTSSTTYNTSQVTFSPSGVHITAQYDTTLTGVLTGAYETVVDLSDGGIISMDILAAVGSRASDASLEDLSVTSVVLVDSPAQGVLADFEFESRNLEYPATPSVNSFGFQIHHAFGGSNEKKIVLWSKSDNSLIPLAYVSHNISHIDLTQVHTYTIAMQQEKLNVGYTRWAELYIDAELIATLHGIAPLGSSARLAMHVFTREGAIPALDNTFSVPSVTAVFRNITLPLATGHICDYGRPFYSATSPIVEFSAEVGTSPGAGDVLGHQVPM